MKRESGFTLIELLIVVAIIAILAAIAVPNFLEAQTRAKVSRVRTDMRTVAVAMEAYAVDNNKYAICLGRGSSYGSGGVHHLTPLTTPVAYLTSVSYPDPFKKTLAVTNWQGWLDGSGDPYSYGFACIEYLQATANYRPHHSAYVIVSNGPDHLKGPDPTNGQVFWYQWYGDVTLDKLSGGKFTPWNYDPTNGTVSYGDIIRWQSNIN
jgi:prepilin-type N-terminal cleavage/methylation domain-containing protein